MVETCVETNIFQAFLSIMENLSWTVVYSQDVQVKLESFWRAIDIWWLKPHVINRRLSAAVEEHRIDGHSGGISPETLPELSGLERPIRTEEQWLASLLEDLKQLASQEESTKSVSVRERIDHHVSDFNDSRHERLPNPNEQTRSPTKRLLKRKSASFSEETDVEKNVQNVKTSEQIVNDETMLVDETKDYVICIRKLLSRRSSDAAVREVGIFDHQRNEATFILLECGIGVADFPAYKFSFHGNRISLLVDDTYTSCKFSASIPSIEWLRKTLAPKLIKWASESRGSEGAVEVKPLVPMDRYTELYQEMKQKYGVKFVKIWPENTDPKKFVYEDVAIATYLLLLFEEERKESGEDKKQSFVDLGCGNGFLVHILNSEGYPGKGIDLRRRKIWDLYGPETHLEESTIIASMETSFRDSDWLIGNHSDELTPWMPVMAARSSYKTRYFVLPCCLHDFDAKFNHRVSGQSQYRTYLDFVREAGEMCGFEVEEDRMRIPSTKRVCHVGRRKTYFAGEHHQVLTRIEEYVARRCKKSGSHGSKNQTSDPPLNSEPDRTAHRSSEVTGHHVRSPESAQCDSEETVCTQKRDVINLVGISTDGQCTGGEVDGRKNLAPGFKPRAVEERVRNCTRVERSLKDRITLEVAWAILEDGGVRRLGEDEGGDQGDTERSSKEPRLWRRGGSIGLGKIAKLFDGPTLKNLKSECGGIKTLLRNYNQVFSILGNQVSLRDWAQVDATNTAASRSTPTQSEKRDRDRQLLYKTKPCWFHDHHPDGCPRMAEACPFAHGQVELRSRPTFGKTTIQDQVP